MLLEYLGRRDTNGAFDRGEGFDGSSCGTSPAGLLHSAETVASLYVHPDLRRRLRRPAVRSKIAKADGRQFGGLSPPRVTVTIRLAAGLDRAVDAALRACRQ